MKKVREGYRMTEIGEIPSEWEVKELIEICVGKGEYGIGASAVEYVEGNPRYLRISDIGENCRLLFNDIKGIKEEEFEKYLLNKGDIVFARTGNTTGKAYVYEEEHGELVYAGFLIKFSINQQIAKHNFIKYVIQSKRYWNWVGVMSTRSGQPGINSNEYSSFGIQLPTMKEQEEIASILSTVDEQIDNVDELIKKNNELKKGLMQQLLTKGICHTKFKKTEIGEIPEAWEVKKLEDVFEILDNMRKPIKASERENMKGNIPYYGASGIIDWVNDYIFDDELILLGEDGENLNSRNTDLVFKVTGKSWVNNHAHVFKVSDKNKCNIDFMVYYLEAKDYSIYIAGSAQPKITQAQCRKFLLPLPKKLEQDKISSILLSVDKKIEEYKIKKQKLEELKKGLMQQLLTGKIRVI